MKVNVRLRNAVFEVIDNQIAANSPAETALTFQRLLDEGYSEFQVRQLIGQALVVELWDALKNKKPYNEARYLENLRNLPREPKE